MRQITGELTTDLLNHFGDPKTVSAGEPYLVKTYRELVEHTARLSYLNKDYLLFYRGQATDFRTKGGSSSFYPSIYRGDYVLARELHYKFEILEGACKALCELFEKKKIEGHKELKKRKYIQWSILQHYEVCSTPLLDFTQSLRVACSFATEKKENDFGYVSVFGFPYLSNRISINSEHDLVNIRLLSICPPNALRPYFQEGYLTGTDDITTNFDSKGELDFKNRLIAKFKIPNDKSFWGNGFHKIPSESLYPDNDPIEALCKEIKDFADKDLKSGDIGDFLKLWTEIEEILLSQTVKVSQRYLTPREAIKQLREKKAIDKELFHDIERGRIVRNSVVHAHKKLSPKQIRDAIVMLDGIIAKLKIGLRKK